MIFTVDIDNHWTVSHLDCFELDSPIHLTNSDWSLNINNFVVSGILCKNHQIVTFKWLYIFNFFLHFDIIFLGWFSMFPLYFFFYRMKFRCRSTETFISSIFPNQFYASIIRIRPILISVIMSYLIRYLDLKGRKQISSSKI